MLKERLRAERQAAGYHLRTLMPQARQAATIGTLVWGVRKALPLVRPLVIGLAQSTMAARGGKRILKIAGIAALGVGAWKVFGPSGED